MKIPENKDKKYDNFIKCECVKCKISHINSSRFCWQHFGLRIIACQFLLPNQCLWGASFALVVLI